MTRSPVGAGVLFLLLLSSSGGIHGAQHQPDPPRFRVGVDVVRIDAVVTDRDGNLVTDLTADEFEVRQDGDVQVVTLARYVPADGAAPAPPSSHDLPPTAAVPGIGAPPPGRGDVQRTMVLVVDDLGIAWENMEPTRRALRRFVAEHVRPTDLVGVVKTSVNAGVGQQLTRDRRLLNAAIEQVKWSGFSRREITSFRPLHASLPTGDSAGRGVNTGFRRSDPTALGRVDALRETMSSSGTLGMLQMAIHGMRDLPGRKAIVLISEGFQILERDPDGTYQLSYLVRDQMERVVDLALRTGVVLYSLDPRGLVTGGVTAEDSAAFSASDDSTLAGAERRRLLLETQETLRFFADQTGGRAIVNNNDIALGLKIISDDLRGYYVIGYNPPDGTFAAPGKTPRFHNVSVTVKRPGLRVRTRKGFLGVADPDRTRPSDTPQQALLEAAMSPFGVSDIPVRATLVPAWDRKGKASVRALLNIDPRGLTFTPAPDGRRAATVEVFGMVFDEWGAPTTGRTAQFSVRLDAGVDPATLESGVVYSLVVPAPKPGGYQARFSVRDAASGAIGVAGEFVDIPDVKKGALALSGVVLGEEARGSSAPEVQTATLAQESSPAFRVFDPGARLVYSYEIYNAASPVETRVVVWRDGKPFFSAPPVTIQPTRKGEALAAAGGIKLGEGMPPGDYVFQVTAATRGKGRKKAHTATRWTSFEVRETHREHHPSDTR